MMQEYEEDFFFEEDKMYVNALCYNINLKCSCYIQYLLSFCVLSISFAVILFEFSRCVFYELLLWSWLRVDVETERSVLFDQLPEDLPDARSYCHYVWG